MRIEDEIKQFNFKNSEQKASLNLIYTTTWLNQQIYEIFKQEQVTKQQYNILRILRGQHPKPISIKEIRERMIDKMSDVSRIVEKLRVKGLAERQENKSDRRNVDVVITKKGLEMLTRLDPKMDEIYDIFSTLSEDELTLLNKMLDKLRG